MVLLIKWTGVKMGESVLGLVRPLLHYIKFPKIWIDNTVFRLHAKVNRFITKIWIDNTVFRLHAEVNRFITKIWIDNTVFRLHAKVNRLLKYG